MARSLTVRRVSGPGSGYRSYYEVVPYGNDGRRKKGKDPFTEVAAYFGFEWHDRERGILVPSGVEHPDQTELVHFTVFLDELLRLLELDPHEYAVLRRAWAQQELARADASPRLLVVTRDPADLRRWFPTRHTRGCAWMRLGSDADSPVYVLDDEPDATIVICVCRRHDYEAVAPLRTVILRRYSRGSDHVWVPDQPMDTIAKSLLSLVDLPNMVLDVVPRPCTRIEGPLARGDGNILRVSSACDLFPRPWETADDWMRRLGFHTRTPVFVSVSPDIVEEDVDAAIRFLVYCRFCRIAIDSQWRNELLRRVVGSLLASGRRIPGSLVCDAVSLLRTKPGTVPAATQADAESVLRALARSGNPPAVEVAVIRQLARSYPDLPESSVPRVYRMLWSKLTKGAKNDGVS